MPGVLTDLLNARCEVVRSAGSSGTLSTSDGRNILLFISCIAFAMFTLHQLLSHSQIHLVLVIANYRCLPTFYIGIQTSGMVPLLKMLPYMTIMVAKNFPKS